MAERPAASSAADPALGCCEHCESWCPATGAIGGHAEPCPKCACTCRPDYCLHDARDPDACSVCLSLDLYEPCFKISCEHEWLDLPESGTRECENCGEERKAAAGCCTTWLLADWFASMCEQDAETPHECDTLIAAHDVARTIRERRVAPEVVTPPAKATGDADA